MSAERAGRTTPGGAELTAGSLAYALRETLRGPGWHGPSARAALRGITATTASWRPAGGAHCIWELVLHMAYARHAMLGRIGARGRAFPHRLEKSWWPRLPGQLDDAAWASDVKLLFTLDDELRAAIAALPVRALARPRRGNARALGGELLGVAIHDAYHTGQIRLLARIYEKEASR